MPTSADRLLMEQIDMIRAALSTWYNIHQRLLPWRRTRDPYAIWVSEVMLQQTQVATVIPYYERFLASFDHVRRLARAPLQKVLKLWEGLGYYSRARNLHRAAGLVVQRHEGRLPETWAEIRQLPGVGDYIAAAVLSIAFKKPHAVVDGNVKRVLARLDQIEAPINRSNSQRQYQALAEVLLDRHHPGTFNQALMELGALVCRAVNPACPECPLGCYCQAKANATVAEYPRRIKPPPVPHRHLAMGVVVKNNQLLVVRRPEKGLLGGLWEFPNQVVQENQTPRTACLQAISETTQTQARIIQPLARVRHAYTHFKVTAEVFICHHVGGRVRIHPPLTHRWLTLDQLIELPLPKLIHKFLPALNKAFTLPT